MRRQELDGFATGLFGQEAALDLPERAHRGLEVLSEMRGLMAAAFAQTMQPNRRPARIFKPLPATCAR